MGTATEHAVTGARTLPSSRPTSVYLTSHSDCCVAFSAAARRVLWRRVPQASTPKFFQAATQADFLKGEVDNLSIDARGQLTLGPATDLVYEPRRLCLDRSARHRRVAVPRHRQRRQGVSRRLGGQGHGLLRQRRARGPRAGDRAERGLYVAHLAGWDASKVDRTAGAKTFFEPEEKYIWSLVGQQRRRGLCGTGEKGVI